MSKFFNNIFLISSLFLLTLSQNIITSWTYDKVAMYTLQKFSKILGPKLEEGLIKEKFPDISEGTLKITNIKLTSVKPILTDSYISLRSGFFLFGPNKVTLSFECDYELDSKPYNTTFDFKPSQIEVKVQNMQNTKVNMKIQKSDFVVYVETKDVLEKMKEALYNKFNTLDVQKIILDQIKVDSYYTDFYSKKQDFKFISSWLFNSKEFTIKRNKFIGYCTEKDGLMQTGVCYSSGELEKEAKGKMDAIKNKQFYKEKDTYNTFINMDLVNEIIEGLQKDKITHTYDKTKQQKKTKDLGYDFTFKSLKTVFSEIKGEYADADEFSIDITVNSFSLENVKMTCNVNIKDQKNVFSFDVELKINKHVTINRAIHFNLCINTWEVLNIKANNAIIKNENALRDYIHNSLDNKNNPLCLGYDGACMRDFYSKIKSAEIKEEGIYIKGDHLYQ